MQIECPSQIEAVAVFARGAVVTRRVEVPSEPPDGDLDLVVPGVTPLAEPGSVRAAVQGGSREVVSVHSALAVPATPAVAGPSVERVRALDLECARLRSEMELLSDRGDRLRELRLEPRLSVAARGPAADERVSDALAASQLLAEILARDDERLLELADLLREREREREAAALADAQMSSAERMGTGHPMARVTLRLSGAGPIRDLRMTYVVPAARWWPVYTLRLGEGGSARFRVEALVAQLTGEDWKDVRLSLSTADLAFDARLPELPSLRLGRAQPPPRRGYRELPAGLDRMFLGFDRAFPEPTRIMAKGRDDLADRSAAPEEELEVAEAFGGAPEPAALVEQAWSLPARAMPMAKRGILSSLIGAGRPATLAMAPMPLPEVEAPPEAPIEPADAWLDFDSLTLPAAGPRRGSLVKTEEGRQDLERRQSAAVIEELEPPVPVRDPLATRGRFDHRYEAQGLAEVPSDAREHRVPVSLGEGSAQIRYRTAPCETPEVFREARLKNPAGAPLCAGPVDVYVEDSLVTSSLIEAVDVGGDLVVGMGAEERIRVARNVRVSEESAGLLGGSTEITHAVTLDLSSSLGLPTEVEVLERVPVSDDKEIEVRILSERPPAAPYDQADLGAPIRGGRRWQVPLDAAGKASLELKYLIKLPSRCELQGGNRRG